MNTPKKRGGFRVGAGRKPQLTPKSQRFKRLNLDFSVDEYEKFCELAKNYKSKIEFIRIKCGLIDEKR